MKKRLEDILRLWATFEKETLILILLASAIFFTPRFRICYLPGNRPLDIRIEDILLLIFGLFWLFSFPFKKEKPPFFLPILSLAGISTFSTFSNILLGNLIPIKAFFYLLKELEYFFLYFFVYFHLKNKKTIFTLFKFWSFFGLFNLSYLLFQILNKTPFGEYRRGVHYLSAIGESGIFPLSGFFLISFLYLFSYFIFSFPKLKKREKIIHFLSLFGFVLGILGLMRRNAFLAFFVCSFLLFLIYFLKRKNLKKTLIFAFLLISISLFSLFLLWYQKISFREEFVKKEIIDWEMEERLNLWKKLIKKPISGGIFHFLFGFGKSFYEEPHNQYVRNFLEIGVMGTTIFFFFIFSILKKLWQRLKKAQNSLDLSLLTGAFLGTLALLFLSIFADAFVVVKINETFWFFMALTTAKLKFKNNEEN